MKKPNILYLVADQFRGDTLGCVGHPDIKTPYYDALANSGTLFKNAYSTNPVCVPARVTMITGKYSHKCVMSPDGYKGNGGQIKPEEFRLPKFLKENGYNTYSSGKLHYLPYTPPGTANTLNGFEKAALAESGRMLSAFDSKNQLRGVEDYIDYLEDVGWKGYSRAHGIGNNDIHPAASSLPSEHHVDSWVATRAIGYIEEHLKNHPNNPFLVHASFPKPHAPYDPPRPFDQMYDPRIIQKPAIKKDSHPRTPSKEKERITHGINYMSPEAFQVARSHYYGLISFQDQQVGKIINYLKENGLYENTIVVFTADHGDMLGDFGYFFKANMHQGSVNVPLIFSWPAKLKKGVISESLVGIHDIVPTLLDLLELNSNQKFDGVSLKTELNDKGAIDRQQLISYCLESPMQTYMVRDKRWKYIYSEANGVEELYDMLNDHREETNVYDLHPQLVEEMKNIIIAWATENNENKILSNGKLIKTEVSLQDIKFTPSSMGWRWY